MLNRRFVLEQGDADSSLYRLGKVRQTPPGAQAGGEEGGEQQGRPMGVSQIAKPLADEKLTKKVLKVVKKGGWDVRTWRHAHARLNLNICGNSGEHC